MNGLNDINLDRKQELDHNAKSLYHKDFVRYFC